MPERSVTFRSAARALVVVTLAGCTLPPAPPAPAGPTAPRATPTALELHYVEASGPPPQDPTRVVPAPTVEDPSALPVRVATLERELAEERARRTACDGEVARLQTRVHDLEARVLSLTLERAALEQEALRLRIEALRAELARLGVRAAEPGAREPASGPPSGGR